MAAAGLALTGCSNPATPPTPASRSTATPACDSTKRVIDETIGGHQVKAVLTLMSVDSCPGAPRVEFWGAFANDLYVSGLELSVDGENILVSPSAHLDLANPAEITLKRDGRGYVLRIIGRGECRYIADLHFDDKGVRSRTVWSVGFEDDVIETTHYKFIIE